MEPRNPKSPAPPATTPHTATASGSSSRPALQSQGMSRTENLSQTGSQQGAAAKKRKHRGGRKKKNRRQSFAAPSESTVTAQEEEHNGRRPSLLDGPRQGNNSNSLYRLQSDNRSNTSLESEALLDHRDQLPFRARRRSNSNSMFNPRSSMSQFMSGRKGSTPTGVRSPNLTRLRQQSQIDEDFEENSDGDYAVGDDRTPLLGTSRKDRDRNGTRPGTSRSGTPFGGTYGTSYLDQHVRPGTSPETRKRNNKGFGPQDSDDDFDVNNPPSMPGSPKLGSLDDVMIAEDFSHRDEPHDAVIDIDGDADDSPRFQRSPARSPSRRPTMGLAEMDVCFPHDAGMSDIDFNPRDERRSPRRRRRRQWPDLAVLDEWTREEKEFRDAEQIRAKKMTEPVMVGGRLRNAKQIWHREEDDAPYRYTYFNENFDATIHSRTISELCQFGATFSNLFKPEAPELSDSSSDEDEPETVASPGRAPSANPSEAARGRASLSSAQIERQRSHPHSGSQTPVNPLSQPTTPHKAKRLGPRPTFWLDVLSPTETEMKVLAKAFGIHQLTVEDILVQEPREKVELFQNYYFVNYRSFEQDKDSEDYMEPVNIYVIVFRDGVLSFHFSMTPHPANVRRRVRQLNDYMSPSADWMSYAIIDDVTDAYAPLVQQVEDEVDDIDENILALHSTPEKDDKKDAKSIFSFTEKKGADAKSDKSYDPEEGRQMLRRIGECRKKVMSLYRLLGNKADVIKGFAKRCNEQWQVAPRSEIGLYLGDIQDHIVTMTGNLSHYENLLSRAHSNYLAQINIRTSERAEQTNDVLGKLTVLGTIVLPMNVITGIWGMNCWVPGQDREHDLTWFWGITSGLLVFGLTCYLIAKTMFGIV